MQREHESSAFPRPALSMSVSSRSLLFYLPKCTNSAARTREFARCTPQFMFSFYGAESAVFGFTITGKFKHVIQIIYCVQKQNDLTVVKTTQHT